MSHPEKTAELFESGYNCAQSVFTAFCDQTGLEPRDALRLSSSFGGGMGRLREVCGALTGALMALGMLRGYDCADCSREKAVHYLRVQRLAGRFREEYGSLLCRDLLGEEAGTGYIPEERTPEYYQKRRCAEYVKRAAQLLDEMLQEEDVSL